MSSLARRKRERTISPDVMERCYQLSPKAMYATFMAQPISFWCACAYLFLEYVRPQSIYPWLDFLPWPLLALGLCLAACMSEQQHSGPSGGISTGLVTMSIVVLLSSLASHNMSTSFSNWRAFFDWIIIYFIVRRAVNSETKLLLFTILFFLANFKMTQHGFFSWATRGFAFADWGVTGGPGWFHNSGEFGIQICIFAPMLLGVSLALKDKWSSLGKYLVAFILFTALASAIASSSRGALVGLAAALIWMTMRSKYFIRAVLAVGIVGTIIYFSIPEESMARFQASGSDQTSLHRLERWQHSWQAMKDNPILGVGYKSWNEYYAENFSPQHKGTPMVHNIFFEAGSELGFTGLIVFIGLIFLCLRATHIVRKTASTSDDAFLIGLSYGLDGALVGMLVSSSFVTVFYYPYFWIHCLFVSCLFSVAHCKKPLNKG